MFYNLDAFGQLFPSPQFISVCYSDTGVTRSCENNTILKEEDNQKIPSKEYEGCLFFCNS